MAKGYIIGAVPLIVDVADFPAVGDVEKDVVYDDGAKTGTFKVPPETKVEKNYQYGKDDTEFTGVLRRFILPLGGKLQKKHNITGTLRKV